MMRPTVRQGVLAAAALLLVGTAGGVAGGVATAGESPNGPAPGDGGQARTILPSARPAARPPAGTPPAADPQLSLRLRVYLAGQDPQARVRTAHAVSTPGNAAYTHYLTPTDYQRRFAPTAAQTTRVSDWLTRLGMKISATNAHFIAVTATVAQINEAFAAHLVSYNGFLVPAGDISVPPEVGADVATVTGLAAQGSTASADPATASADPATASADPATASADPATASADPANPGTAARPGNPPAAAASGPYPCSHWWGEHTVPIPPAYGHTTAPTDICGYTVKQMRNAYGITNSPYTGKGATVAIVLNNGSPTMAADANRFFADQGVPGFAPGQYRENFSPTFTSTCDRYQKPSPGSGPEVGRVEQAIDVESVHIFAPDANVVYVGADCGANLQQDLLDAHTRVVDQHLADVTSDSFSVRETTVFTRADVAAWDLMFQQGTIEGIGFNFNSGDDGDLRTGTSTEVTFPASDPWATGVGGTSLRLGRNGEVIGESGWGDNQATIRANGYVDRDGQATTPPGAFLGGSGGGLSTYFDQPEYQRGVVPDTLATTGGRGPARRVVPDLAANAGLPWQIGFTGARDQAGGYDVIAGGGGTSAASPLLAALAADAKQATGHALGFLNL